MAIPVRRVILDTAGGVCPAEERLQADAVRAHGGGRPAGTGIVLLGQERDEVIRGELAQRLGRVAALELGVGVAPGLAGVGGTDGRGAFGVEDRHGVGPQRGIGGEQGSGSSAGNKSPASLDPVAPVRVVSRDRFVRLA